MALLFANNSSLANITALPASVSGGGLNLIKTQTASSSASISFVNGVDGVVLDGTYKEYIFKFINVHPSVDGAFLQFNMSIDGGSNYNVTKTTTSFGAYHRENDEAPALSYFTAWDLAQSTSDQVVHWNDIGADADQNLSGTMQLFNPSSTTYVKHFIIRSYTSSASDYACDGFIAGYGNTTSAINGVRFQMSSGNIDDGIIKLYGVS